MLSIFSCVPWPSVCLFWRNVYLGLLWIFWLDSSFAGFVCVFCFVWYWAVSCLYKIKPLSVTLFANIFSHSISCLFNIDYDFLCYVEVCKFGNVPFFLIFALFLFYWETYLRKHCHNLRYRMLCLFFSRNF